MKKRSCIMILSLLFVFVCVGPALAAYKLSYFYVQHRLYQDGRDFNRIWFEFRDENGNNISQDRLQSAVLRDPNGNRIDITNLAFSPDAGLEGSYDGSQGLWVYKEEVQNFNGYVGTVEVPLIEGTYRLSAKYAGVASSATFQFNGLVKLPVIQDTSIRSSIDRWGNLICTWKAPSTVYNLVRNEIQTSVRVIINVYDGNSYVEGLTVRVPTHLGCLFVPKTIIDVLTSNGNQFKIGIQLRTNDNNNRTYSNFRTLALVK